MILKLIINPVKALCLKGVCPYIKLNDVKQYASQMKPTVLK